VEVSTGQRSEIKEIKKRSYTKIKRDIKVIGITGEVRELIVADLDHDESRDQAEAIQDRTRIKHPFNSSINHLTLRAT
jgi:hypothetical protein